MPKNPEEQDEEVVAGEGEKPARTVPYERFSQVYGDNKEWKSLGDRAEVKARLDRLQQIDDKIKDYQEKQAAFAEAQNPKGKIRQQLYEVDPELKDIASFKKEIREAISEMREMRHQEIMKGASSYLTSYLKDAGINVDRKMQDRMEDYLMTQMSEEDGKALDKGNYLVLNAIMEKELGEGGFLRHLKSVQKAAYPGALSPPVRHKGGVSAPDKPKKSMTKEELIDASWERFQAGMAE